MVANMSGADGHESSGATCGARGASLAWASPLGLQQAAPTAQPHAAAPTSAPRFRLA
jgi:hypothetical protein